MSSTHSQIESFKSIFNRDLDRLAKEIKAYEDEDNLWVLGRGITNTAGNLCLHLVGNLNTFIGHHLGGTDYKRDRELEFAGKGIPREFLLEGIKNLQATLDKSFTAMEENQLNELYPVEVLGKPMSVHHFLTHLTGHTMYHIGQINYHRRMLDHD